MYPRPAGDDAGRRALQAVTLGAELRERGIGLHVIEQGVDADTGPCSGCSASWPNGGVN